MTAAMATTENENPVHNESRFPLEAWETTAPLQAIERLIDRAADYGASDVFLLTEDDGIQIAARWLGQVHPITKVPLDRGKRLMGAIKAAAEIDIAEHRTPLEGHWVHALGDRKLDLRVSVVPTLYGQDMTVRILDRQARFRSLDRLGMTPNDLARVRPLLHKSGGLILVTGPTGAGKTTTLYACLDYLNDGRRKINTLEDPIEFALPGVRQSQVQPRTGLDFAHLLRGVLRQSPDVIMIGEIRDPDTAATAVHAANSGHLVLATLHAPGAAAAVQGMLSLGVHRYFLSSSLLGVLAQRLVRVLCTNCRRLQRLEAPRTFDEVRPWLDDEAETLYTARGCDACRGVGYAAQTGVFEVMTLNDELRALIAEGSPGSEIERHAIGAGMIEFRRAALLRVAQGTTSVEEVLRVMPPECFLGNGI